MLLQILAVLIILRVEYEFRYFVYDRAAKCDLLVLPVFAQSYDAEALD